MPTPLGDVWKSFPELYRKRKLQQTAPRWLYPIRVEARYRNYLQSYLSLLDKVIRESFNSSLLSDGLLDVRTDSEWTDRLAQELEGLSKTFSPEGLDSQLVDIFDRTDVRNTQEWKKYQRFVVGLDFFSSEDWIKPFAEMWIGRNHTLIKSLTEDIVKKVEITITNGVMEGKHVKSISKELYGEGGIIEGQRSRANLIARDQVSKLNGSLTRKRQEDGGLELYVWRDASDERVRSTHSAHDGLVYAWNNPPANTGNPSEDYQCRCYGEPLMVFDLTNAQKSNLIGFPVSDLSFDEVA